jgi:hypothetical protein
MPTGVGQENSWTRIIELWMDLDSEGVPDDWFYDD